MMQRSNRKSHLTAPLSPATQALLRSEGPFSGGHSPSRTDTSNSKTPTSGDIPIGTSTSNSSAASYNSEPVHRVLSADVNGNAGMFPNQSPLERPSFPPRTSSTSVISSGGRSRNDDHSFIQPQSMTSMPIRPAPPPGGPLPMPPRAGSRRLGLNGSTYPHINGDGYL